MAETIVELLTDVADAIREKKGTTEKINAQNFSDEIKNLPSGSSPFAVDFGEEIASGHPTFINALQEDIDYYNEVQRKRLAGEVTDAQLLASKEFKEKIAWWPRGMAETDLVDFINLREVNFTTVRTKLINCPKLGQYKGSINLSDRENLAFCQVAHISTFAEDSGHALILNLDALTNMNRFACTVPVRTARLSLPNTTSVHELFARHLSLLELYLDIPKVQSLSFLCRGGSMRKIYANIKAVRSISVSFDLLYVLEELHIDGLAASLNCSGSNVYPESVKFILDHCQQREDGAAYTLTLGKDWKDKFLAKCDEDAEYAASLASANAKGLTLA